ncbi:hypothetical protein [Helicobacter sp. 23-1045]
MPKSSISSANRANFAESKNFPARFCVLHQNRRIQKFSQISQNLKFFPLDSALRPKSQNLLLLWRYQNIHIPPF